MRSLTCWAQLFYRIRKCTWQPAIREGPFILHLFPYRSRRERERSREIPWDFIRPPVGIALCKTKAPFERSVGLVSLYITQHRCSGMGHVQPQPKVATALPPASAPLFPACLSEVSKSFSETPTALPLHPCSGSKVLFALQTVPSLPGGNVAAPRRVAGAGGEGRAAATVCGSPCGSLTTPVWV